MFEKEAPVWNRRMTNSVQVIKIVMFLLRL